MAVREREGVETPHSSSMLAAYEAAINVTRCARSQYAVMPQARPIWFVWNAAFSACVRRLFEFHFHISLIQARRPFLRRLSSTEGKAHVS